MPSDITVFVRFQEKSVFAGEQFTCIITFKNTADSDNNTPHSTVSGRTSIRSGNSHGSSQSVRPPLHKRGPSRLSQIKNRHQASFSLSNPPQPRHPDQPPLGGHVEPRLQRQRSVSIVSVGSTIRGSSPDRPLSNQSHGLGSRTGHRRSSTVQHVRRPQQRPSLERQRSGDGKAAVWNGRRSPLSASDTISDPIAEAVPDFKFPPANFLNASTPESGQGTPVLGPRQRQLNRNIPQPASRRNSVELYNHSNHSGETMASEQPSVLSDRPQLPALMGRSLRTDNLVVRKAQATSLLMGYAQVNATFTLDASMVDQMPFEEVKKKGFLGGQAGGGVVGVKKKTRPSSGLFGSFGFGSLGESLESIMGGDHLSSVKEMNAVTNSRAIPLLSTPQSLLFVDLHLEPGEEKSFSFSFTLPNGLPSSYRGKAIKIAYNLTIGVQGAPGNKEMQAIRQVNVPIRVFSGVDADGEIFGHDLMQPYVMMKDTASTKAIDPNRDDHTSSQNTDERKGISSDEFLRYVENLLNKSRRRQSSSATIDAIFGTFAPEKSAAVQAINKAIMLSNQITATSESSPNRFEIARSGSKIATVILDRPLHRLGESVTTVVDFSDGQMTCASLRATLETAERVSGLLAIRSASAISRITKKVYGSQSENVLFVDRAVFSPTIPANAAPTFITSGVSLEWYVKLEFGTVRSSSNDAINSPFPKLLEEVIQDERGSVNVAVESIDCDTFEVLIPITVYGDLIVDGKDSDDAVGIPI